MSTSPPATNPLAETCSIAFKEWAGICAAIRSGRQTIILRKGGIAEGPGGFKPEHDTFWLYPTYVHEAEQGLKSAGNHQNDAEAGHLQIDTLVRVESVTRIESLPALEALAGLHDWTPETVQKRFHYKKPGIYVLGVRAYALDQPHEIEVTPEQLGCKSWVPLDAPLSTHSARPVRTDSEAAGDRSRLAAALPQPKPPRWSLMRELKETPATYALGAAWVLVYVLINLVQGGFSLNQISLLGFGAVRPEVSHFFGDLTWRDFSAGQPWRAITATFIHFSLAHLLLNLIGLIQLGRSVEEWYGSRQFFAICIALGAIGNLIGVTARHFVSASVLWLQAHGFSRLLPDFIKNAAGLGNADIIPAAGGSTIILGLIGLGLVVGWRSRTRVGMYLRDQMFGLLIFTAIIGIICWSVIDNYGHAGGAIAGFLVGLLHRFFVKHSEKGSFRTVLLAGSVLLVFGCATLQAIESGREQTRIKTQRIANERLVMVQRVKALRDQLTVLPGQYELVAMERLGPWLTGNALLNPSTTPELFDISPAYELSQYGGRGALPPGGPPPEAVMLLRRLLVNVNDLRPLVDPSINGPEFDVIERIGGELCERQPSSADTLAFRIARLELLKRTTSVLNRLTAEVEASDAAQQTSR